MNVQVKCRICGRKVKTQARWDGKWPMCCGETMMLSKTGGKRMVKAFTYTKESYR